MKNSNHSNEVMKYAARINRAVNAQKSSTKRIFELLMDAHSSLSPVEYQQLKRAINVDKSSIHKVEKIFANEVVMEHLSVLPVSWGTLHELSLIDKNWFLKFVGGVLTGTNEEIAQLSKITRSEAQELREASLAPDADTKEASVSPAGVSPSISIKLSLREGITMDANVLKQVEHFADQLSKEIFEVKVAYSSLPPTNVVPIKIAC